MDVDWNKVAHDADHRPWPVPAKPWVMTMSWLNLLFAHWPVAPDVIEPHLPEGLELDTFDGKAWISVVAFVMDNTLPRGMTWWPRPMRFLELNLRTYVTAGRDQLVGDKKGGEKPGVWFFSLDAESPLAVVGARTTFHLPYFHADMSIERSGQWVDYRSRRTHRGYPEGKFSACYQPTGPAATADEGTLAYWLSERYCLYAADASDTIYRGDINHEPWPLRPAEVHIRNNTLGHSIGLDLDEEPALVNFAERQDVVGWFRQRLP